ncbi:MAG: DUF2334 domain-containing protein [Nanoarchaeota archaeon]|nr:DUF2334 domain-containing protein [Nanoarchaeota archaeon]
MNDKEIILRIDDVGGNEYEKIIPLMIQDLIKRGFIASLGVIPKRIENSNYLHKIKDATNKGFEIVMHSFNHKSWDEGISEFYLESLKDEGYLKFIRQGKEILNKIFNRDPLTFIPHQNKILPRVEGLLSQEGFKIISSGKGQNGNILSWINFTSRTAPPKSNEPTKSEIIIREINNKKEMPVLMIHPFEYMDQTSKGKVFNSKKYCLFVELLEKLKDEGYETISFQEARH